ncbi:hypothetical protein DFS34DRAFT_457035 [Phlyctochytrium arcticum]|nr:hypothetical protein DFS34DRAFT_457035 [Phlyctochytrium arcticum]
MNRPASIKSTKSRRSNLKNPTNDHSRRQSEDAGRRRERSASNISRRSSMKSAKNVQDASEYALALYDYRGSTDEELNYNEGDTFLILSTENLDWWLVRTLGVNHFEGFVPTTYVRKLETDEVDDMQLRQHSGSKGEKAKSPRKDEDDESSGYRTSDESEDYEDATDGDFENDRVAGSDPVSIVRRVSHPHPAVSLTGGRRNRWPDRRPSKKRLVPADTLKGFGTLPQGYRMSTLTKTFDEGIGHLSRSLTPKLTPDGLEFKDLQWNHVKDKIKKRPANCTIAFSLLDARCIPHPGPHVRVVGRCVRMALFDKSNILSNIHAVPAVYNPEMENMWRFSTKASLLFPKDDENTCFLRVNDVDVNLCILFEHCIIVEREQRNGGLGIAQLSCGWGILPLYSADGGPIENKTYEIKLHGGTPFERNIKLYEEPPKPGLLASLIQPNRSPRLNVRVWKLGKSALQRLDHLPDTLLSFLSAVPVFSMYRQVLADALVAPKREHTFVSVAEPALGIFPVLAEENDLLRLLVAVWERTWRDMPRREKRSLKRSKHKLTQCIMAVWPLLHVRELPKWLPGHTDVSRARQAIIQRFQEIGVLDFLGKTPPNTTLRPFDASEVHFNCLASIAAAGATALAAGV